MFADCPLCSETIFDDQIQLHIAHDHTLEERLAALRSGDSCPIDGCEYEYDGWLDAGAHLQTRHDRPDQVRTIAQRAD